MCLKLKLENAVREQKNGTAFPDQAALGIGRVGCRKQEVWIIGISEFTVTIYITVNSEKDITAIWQNDFTFSQKEKNWELIYNWSHT